MKHLYFLLLLGILGMCLQVKSQVLFGSGNAPGSTQLVPFVSSCFGAGNTIASSCGLSATFQFTNGQCCPCPTSGMVCLPGSVAYGGTGSSASFFNYHTLSYSPNNENQRLTFSGKINKFQWSASGPAGAFPEPFNVSVYDGAALVGSFTFTVPGQGIRNTYYITGPQFDRIDFVETTAISADDELFGDFRIATAGCPLALSTLNCDLAVLGPQRAKIHWTTENEENLIRHTLLRSADGQIWDPISVQPALNTAGPNHYSYMDAHALVGTNYYRVVTEGQDGYEASSNVVEAQFADGGNIKIVLFPNPVADRLWVNFAGLEGKKDLNVVNQLGQVIAAYSTEAMEMELPTDALSNAIYFLVVTSRDGATASKFEVKR